MPAPCILIADDDRSIRTVLTQALERAGYQVRATASAATLWRWVEESEGAVVITDVLMPGENGLDLIPRIRRLRPTLPVIVMSAQSTLTTAIQATQRGAFEYLPKPFDLTELLAVVKRALNQPHSPQASPAAPTTSEQTLLMGSSAAMQEIYRVIARLTTNDLTVLIHGESGVGKELIARALHEFGPRRHRPFVALNMAAIAPELLDSELFGHERGAFAAATTRHVGRFEQAAGGTLFLDEVGDMPPAAQSRLLRVLQEGAFTTLGGRTPMRANVRIVAATQHDLPALIKDGRFREDLFYRLNVVPLRVPPLRERPDDIPVLAEHFLKKAHAEGLPAKTIDPAASAQLRAYRWPGNVRELENLMRRLAALAPHPVITADIIGHECTNDLPAKASMLAATHEAVTDFSTILAQHFAQLLTRLQSSGEEGVLYERALADLERPLLQLALAETRGNQIKAATLLGLNRNTLRKKLRDRFIDVQRRIG